VLEAEYGAVAWVVFRGSHASSNRAVEDEKTYSEPNGHPKEESNAAADSVEGFLTGFVEKTAQVNGNHGQTMP